jgi:2-polyprenyl-6-methoxyphenol hydroxylase-like FAD-dependent oxidoreductase
MQGENVSFGKKLDRITASSSDSAKHTLHFADGTQETDYDLIIGGDGAWSKVRSLLSDVKPQYSGISMVEVNCHDIKANQWLVNYIGIGSMFSFGEGRAVLSQRQGDGSLRTYACLRGPENFLETCGIDWKDESSARKQWIERYFSDIGEELKRVVLDSKDSLIPRALFELPIGFNWSHRSGVTLIGDAAHLMTPFAGVGVNVGMTDALVLGREIVAASRGEKGLEAAVESYEKEMFPRAKKYMEKTEWGKKNHFSANGAKAFADMMRAHHQPA